MANFAGMELLNQPSKLTFAEILWCRSAINENDLDGELYEAFFEYVSGELSSLRHHEMTLQNLMDLVNYLRQHVNESRNHLRSIHIPGICSPGEESRSLGHLELVVRLWITINVSSKLVVGGIFDIGTTRVNWPDHSSVKGLVADQFPEKGIPDFGTGKRIQEALTAESLCNLREIQIVWTNNLADHLRLDSDRFLRVYQHKVCLDNHLKSAKASGSLVFPPGFLEETIDTLNLLFPLSDQKTVPFLKKHQKHFYQLGGCGGGRPLDLARYKHWGPRIAELIKIYDAAPQGLLQMAKDRRNFGNWANFWIAIFVALLTLVSIGFGTASTVYAIKQYNLALLQYQLSIAQACSAPEAADQLPAFCS